jgi:hypothetical protein
VGDGSGGSRIAYWAGPLVATNGTVGVLTLAAVHDCFGKWPAFPADDATRPRYDVVDVALATMVANRMNTDPLWVFLVAPRRPARPRSSTRCSGCPMCFRSRH